MISKTVQTTMVCSVRASSTSRNLTPFIVQATSDNNLIDDFCNFVDLNLKKYGLNPAYIYFSEGVIPYRLRRRVEEEMQKRNNGRPKIVWKDNYLKAVNIEEVKDD